MITRTGKDMKHTSSRFRKFAQGLLSEETNDLMEQNGYRPIYINENRKPSDEELEEILGRYIDKPADVVKAAEEYGIRRSVQFKTSRYEEFKELAKENNVPLYELFDNAMKEKIIKEKLNKKFIIEIDLEAKDEDWRIKWNFTKT